MHDDEQRMSESSQPFYTLDNKVLRYTPHSPTESQLTNIDIRKISHLNIKTKMFDIEARVLIGWYSLASQSERVHTRCFYVKVAYLSYGEYTFVWSPV